LVLISPSLDADFAMPWYWFCPDAAVFDFAPMLIWFCLGAVFDFALVLVSPCLDAYLALALPWCHLDSALVLIWLWVCLGVHFWLWFCLGPYLALNLPWCSFLALALHWSLFVAVPGRILVYGDKRFLRFKRKCNIIRVALLK
jgi:hypothetical protein